MHRKTLGAQAWRWGAGVTDEESTQSGAPIDEDPSAPRTSQTTAIPPRDTQRAANATTAVTSQSGGPGAVRDWKQELADGLDALAMPGSRKVVALEQAALNRVEPIGQVVFDQVVLGRRNAIDHLVAMEVLEFEGRALLFGRLAQQVPSRSCRVKSGTHKEPSHLSRDARLEASFEPIPQPLNAAPKGVLRQAERCGDLPEIGDLRVPLALVVAEEHRRSLEEVRQAELEAVLHAIAFR